MILTYTFDDEVFEADINSDDYSVQWLEKRGEDGVMDVIDLETSHPECWAYIDEAQRRAVEARGW